MTIARNLDSLRTSPIDDAPARNWVDRFAPARLKPWLRLIRADRPIGVWLLLWPCWWSLALASRAGDEFPDPIFLMLFAVGAYAMRGAGCVYNDILDRDLDSQVERTRLRPIASRQISVKAAVVFIAALCCVGLGVLLQFNTFAIALGFASIGLVLIYPLMKRITFWPQAVLGCAFGWGALMGWAVVFAGLALPAFLLYGSVICWIIGYDTIYAHQDKEDDATIGLKSTALRFGDKTKQWLTLFYSLTILGLGLSAYLAEAGLVFFIFLALAAAHFTWQVRTLNINDPDSCLKVFRSNSTIGAIIFAGVIADVLILEMI